MNIFADSFDRSDSSNLGSNWNEAQGDFEIVGNKVSLNVNESTTRCYHTGGPYTSADYSVSATIRFASTTSSTVGVVGRHVVNGANDDLYLAGMRPSSDTVRIIKYSGGSGSIIGNVSFTIALDTDYVVRLEMRGSDLKLFIDDTEYVSITDSDLTAAGDAGLGSAGNTPADVEWDNFSVDDFKVELGGAVVADGDLAADLQLGRPLTGEVPGLTSLSGDVKIFRHISAELPGIASLAGSLSVQGGALQLSGALAAISSIAGDLQAGRALGGLINVSAGLTANLGILRQLSGSLAGLSVTLGELHLGRPFSGLLPGQSDLSATLSVTGGNEIHLSGSLANAGQLASVLRIARQLAGDLQGSGSLTAVLSIDGSTVVIEEIIRESAVVFELVRESWISLEGTADSAITIELVKGSLVTI